MPTKPAGIYLEAGVTSFNFDPTWPNTAYTQIELGRYVFFESYATDLAPGEF